MIKPYYETPNGKLYCGSCLDIMPELEAVNLTITSPPYDNLRDYFFDKFVVWRDTISYEDKQKIIKELQERGIKPVSAPK